ncbi:hypothetical protein Tco_0962793 [Tanacetum coccineum]
MDEMFTETILGISESIDDVARLFSNDSGFVLIAYSDADLAGCLDDYKSTSGGLQFLGDKLSAGHQKAGLYNNVNCGS